MAPAHETAVSRRSDRRGEWTIVAEVTENAASYWYADDDDAKSTEVLEAMRAYRAAEVAMRRRTQQSMDMGENELLVLRYLARARRRDEFVTPVAVSRYLGITSASTTALLDRLARSGHIVREPNPADRRSIIITSSDQAEDEIRHTLSDMHTRMMDVVRGMTPDDRVTVISFLDALRGAVDDIDA